jgi:hypothetical protein
MASTSSFVSDPSTLVICENHLVIMIMLRRDCRKGLISVYSQNAVRPPDACQIRRVWEGWRFEREAGGVTSLQVSCLL